MPITVRRVRADEWELARDLRLEALQDPAAPMAFLESFEQSVARPDDFWIGRAQKAAAGGRTNQLLALVLRAGEGTSVTALDDVAGTVTVRILEPGDLDGQGRATVVRRALLVAVYVRPAHRGTGVIETLVDEAAQWCSEQGVGELYLGVHADNARAQGAYRRAGFVPIGEPWAGIIGPEIDMVLSLSDRRGMRAHPGPTTIDA